MGLAGSFRPDQSKGVGGPFRPIVDELERALVAWSGQKILARVAFRVIERERELTRANGHGAQVGGFPV
jgi:hypothetical protein